jgi:DNA repair exonuclease SbcCD ATPase subunit
MHIIELTAENVKRLKAVTIRPDGRSAVVIGGKNGAGKSSVLDAIVYALGGKKAQPAEPIRHGEKKATVVADLGDLVVRRSITPKGTTVVVERADGARLASPQKVLDELVGKLTFDPLDFTRLDPGERRKTLCKLVGLDTDELDAKRKAAYDARTTVNRDIKELQARYNAAPRHKDSPAEPVDVAELTAELRTAHATNAKNDAARRELNELREKGGRVAAEIRELNARLVELTVTLDDIKARGTALRAEVDQLQDEDTESIVAKIESASELNRKHTENETRNALGVRLAELLHDSDKLSTRIAEIDQVKIDSMASAQYPVEGLALTEDGITYCGLPFEQASQAQQIAVSTAIGLALNPKLRVLLIRDGSLLDEDSLAAIAKIGADHDAQLWIERVGDGEECSVVIEDGEVREQ